MTLEATALSTVEVDQRREGFPDASASVFIRNQVRTPVYAEAAEINHRVVAQAQEIGNLLAPLADNVPQLLHNADFRKDLGMNEEFYNTAVAPFEGVKNKIAVFGVDSVINQEDNSIKFIEINSRPQFLGRFDLFNSNAVGENPNSQAYQVLKDTLKSESKGEGCVVLSHQLNAFHNFHRLLAQQMEMPIATLQDLQVDSDGFVTFNGKRIGAAFRQFSSKSFLDSKITSPAIIKAVQDGKITLINGPLSGRLGEKSLLPMLGDIEPKLLNFLPEMKLITTGDGTNLKDHEGWWLKTTTGGQTELTLRLTKKNLTGWVGHVVQYLVAGDIDAAQKIIQERGGNPTVDRFLTHVDDLRKEHSVKWVLQKHIEPLKVHYNDPENGPVEMNTTLRIYFIRFPGDEGKPRVFLEMLASKYDRVSGAGVTIPLKF